jgi:hypothetical protein
MRKIFICSVTIILLFTACSKKYEVLKQETNFGMATINGNVYKDYVTVSEALTNTFFYTPMNGSGKFQISKDSVAYLQFVLRDASAQSVVDSWVVLVGIPIPDGEYFPIIGKEYFIQYSPLTDHTSFGGGNFYELKLLEQMKAARSVDLPSGVGGLKIPYDTDFIALRGSLTFSNSVSSKDNTKVHYSGHYTLVNLSDEEYGQINIYGNFNLALE